MDSIERKIDATLCTTALIAVVSFFIWMNVPVVREGVGHGDDANAAYIAKSIAVGRGYGFSRSSDEFVVFESPITTSIGPTLILPAAFLIWLFGPVDQLPGAGTLVIFLGQLLVSFVILVRRFGWTPTCGFLSVTLWLLMLASGKMWLFGSLLGEPATFGFILMGTACLVVAKRYRGIAAGGVCLSLALVTKLIAVFPVAGIVGAWLVFSKYDRVERREFFRRAAIFLSAIASLPLTFEVTKLVTLGLAGYRDRLAETLDFTRQMGVGSGNSGSRFHTFRTLFLDSYISTPLLIILITGSVLLLVLSRRSQVKGHEGVVRFVILAWGGAAVHLVYILMFSILWARYFWIGIALMLTAISAPVLAVKSKLRLAFMVMVLVSTLGLGLQRPLLQLRASVNASNAPAERAAVVRLLDEHPDLPYAAHYWSSMFEVVYLRRDEGTWAYGPKVLSLQGRNFVALINKVFTDKESPFFKSVVATCEPLTPAGRLAAYRCGEQFWRMYGSTATIPSAPPGATLSYDGAVDRRDCEAVAGWVMKIADPKADINVGLYIDGQLVETVPARNLRPDLREKFGTGRYGFSFELPTVYKDGKPHTAKVRVRDFDYGVPFNEGVFPAFECKR